MPLVSFLRWFNASFNIRTCNKFVERQVSLPPPSPPLYENWNPSESVFRRHVSTWYFQNDIFNVERQRQRLLFNVSSARNASSRLPVELAYISRARAGLYFRRGKLAKGGGHRGNKRIPHARWMINETGIKGSLGLTSRSDAISAPLFRIGDESLHRPILSSTKY